MNAMPFQKIKTHITKVRLLQSTFDNTGGRLRIACDELAANDRSADQLRSIDNLLYTRHAERDVHGGDTRKVECLQGHLSPWLSDRLSTNSPDS
jgi:hypothetical protein